MTSNKQQDLPSAEEVKRHATNLLQTELSSRQLLQTLVIRLSEANALMEPLRLKMKPWYQVVVVVERMLLLLKGQPYRLARQAGLIYLFTGKYWHMVIEEELNPFLIDVAESLGVEHTQAQHFDFVNKLIRQLNIKLPVPEPPPEKYNLLNVYNGTLEIDTGHMTIREHDPDDFMTYVLPFAYNEQVEAPLFMQFLNRVLPDSGLQQLLAEYIAYLFIPQTALRLEKAMLLHGSGSNGKSVFFNVINAMLGKENICNYSLLNLTDRVGYYRAMIGGKLVNYASEINRNLDTAFYKQMVSGEPIEARLPFGKPFIMHRYAKLMFNTNELPRDVEHTRAYFRRFLIIPFDVVIPDEEQDPELANKIIASELPGVLNWVIKALRVLLVNRRFSDSELSNKAVIEYRSETDSVLLFIDEVQLVEDMISHATLSSIYDNYKNFCAANNYKAFSNKVFRRHLADQGFHLYRVSNVWMVAGTMQAAENGVDQEVLPF